MRNRKESVGSCAFCEEVETGHLPTDFQRAYGTVERIAVRTADFMLWPTVSPLCVGHSLLVPRAHVTRLSDLSRPLKHEFSNLVELVSSYLVGCFGGCPYIFEHGVSGGAQACGVDHAHLHLLPLPYDIVDIVEREIVASFPGMAYGRVEHLLEFEGSNKPSCYLLHGNVLQSLEISWADHIPSQFVRKVISKAQNSGHWDWNLIYGSTEFSQTHQALLGLSV